MGYYQNAIEATKQSLVWHTKESGLPAQHPIDLAIMAMSHLQLGKQSEASDFRKRMSQSMKLDAFKDDEECKTFVAEVNALFAQAESTNESDDK